MTQKRVKTANRPAAVAVAVAAARDTGARVGRIVGFRPGEGLLVDLGGGPVLARSTVALGEEAARRAVAEGREAVLLLEENDSGRPIVVGLLQAVSGTPHLDLMLEGPVPQPAEARVDGKRVVLEGEDEVVLRCGEASITLRRNGKLVIRGTYVVSRAEGTNRIKGGSVQIN